MGMWVKCVHLRGVDVPALHYGQGVVPVSPPYQGYGEATGQQHWWIGLLADDLFLTMVGVPRS